MVEMSWNLVWICFFCWPPSLPNFIKIGDGSAKKCISWHGITQMAKVLKSGCSYYITLHYIKLHCLLTSIHSHAYSHTGIEHLTHINTYYINIILRTSVSSTINKNHSSSAAGCISSTSLILFYHIFSFSHRHSYWKFVLIIATLSSTKKPFSFHKSIDPRIPFY